MIMPIPISSTKARLVMEALFTVVTYADETFMT